MRALGLLRRRGGAALLPVLLLLAGGSMSAGGGPAPISVQPIAVVGASQSSNWSGYNQGYLETGKTYTAITGQWVVPTATQHLSGQAEYSATWVGIGGGCIDSGCTLTDSTLIQAGTEQDVSAAGHSSYYAWWEIIPEPSTSVALPVSPGNRIQVAIKETSQGMWSIVITNLSTGRHVTVATPYLSSGLTAEWITETPVVVGTGGTGEAALPNLSTVTFDQGTVNGAGPHLQAAQQIQLVNSSGRVIAQPSHPDADSNGFNLCAWRTACAVPAS